MRLLYVLILSLLAIPAWTEDKGKVEVIRIPEKDNIIKTVPSSVTNCSKNQVLAQKFNDYIASDKAIAFPELVLGLCLLLLFGKPEIQKILGAAGFDFVFTKQGIVVAQFFTALP